MSRRKSSGSKKKYVASTTCICARWPISTITGGESSASAQPRRAAASARSCSRCLTCWTASTARCQHLDEAPSSVSEGLQLLHRKLLGLLEAQGVTPLQSVGETFNPELHDAIGSFQSEEFESGTVADEVQRGYRWGDDVLRPARVRVAL